MNIIPTPRKITCADGKFTLAGATVFVKSGIDSRVARAAEKLRSEIAAAAGCKVKFTAAVPSGKAVIVTCADSDSDAEGYTLTVTENEITVMGDSAKGAFYGIQSLRQLVKEYGDAIPCCTVEDQPEFPERGFYHDITRGRVPTLTKLKDIAEQLAYFKINALQLYVEDAYEFTEYEGIVTAEECLTAEEMMELDDFCYNNFIELVPSLSTFGHLYRLLQSEKYAHLCEYENYKPTQHYWLEKMAHHTIDVSNPESIELIGSLIDQFVPLFRSNKFNICCDETFDLCRGRNAGKDSGVEYFVFLEKIIERVKAHGKTVMMWGDIALEHPEKMKEIPSDTIMLNWCYEKEPKEDNTAAFAKAGLAQIVCPGTSSWNRFIEEIDRSYGNISKLAEYGKKHGALGILNTNWGDFGNICSYSCSLYGMVLGAQKGWNVDAPCDEDFEKAASLYLYDRSDVNVIDMIKTLGESERTCDWMLFMYWYSANFCEGRNTELEVDRDAAVKNIGRCDDMITKLEALAEGGDYRFVDMLLAARAIRLMNREVLMIKGAEGYTDAEALQADFNNWMKEYRVAWLRDNKVSQIELIGDFMSKITKVQK